MLPNANIVKEIGGAQTYLTYEMLKRMAEESIHQMLKADKKICSVAVRDIAGKAPRGNVDNAVSFLINELRAAGWLTEVITPEGAGTRIDIRYEEKN